MMTYEEWLAKYGQVPCNGCPYFNYVKSRCSYKVRCVRYDEDVKREKWAKREKEKEPTLFDV